MTELCSMHSEKVCTCHQCWQRDTHCLIRTAKASFWPSGTLFQSGFFTIRTNRTSSRYFRRESFMKFSTRLNRIFFPFWSWNVKATTVQFQINIYIQTDLSTASDRSVAVNPMDIQSLALPYFSMVVKHYLLPHIPRHGECFVLHTIQ